MISTIGIFRREFSAKRDFLLIAVAAAVIAYMLPYLPGLEGQDPGDVRSVAAQVIGLGLGLALAVGFGATVLGSDLSAGRLGFYFARPVGAAAVWTGRMLAALAIALVCVLVVSIVAVVEEGPHLLEFNATGWGAVVSTLLVLPTVVFLLSHAVGIMLRARTAWLFLDLAALLAIAVGSWLTLRPLVLMGAVKAATLVGALLVGALAFALAIAGLVGTVVGRTDLRRTHGALSVTLWLVMGLLAAGAAAYGNWLRDFGPGDLNQTEVFSVAPDGGWVEVAGTTAWRFDVWRRFLVSTTGDRWIAAPASFRTWFGEVRTSADAGTAAMFEPAISEENGRTLWWVDLRAHDPRFQETTIVVSGRSSPSLSPDGSRVAILDAALLSVYELESERLLTSISIPEGLRPAVVLFQDENSLLLFARHGRAEDVPLGIARVDLESRTITEIGRIDRTSETTRIAVDAEVRHFVLGRENDDEGSSRGLYDARSGDLIRELEVGGTVGFLTDGRIYGISKTASGRRLLVVESVDGSSRIEHDLGLAPWLWCYGEAVSGSLVVGRIDDLEDREQGRTIELIEFDTGEIHQIAAGLRRGYSAAQYLWSNGISVTWYVNTSEAGRIFEDRTGAIVRWDPETGELFHVVGGRE